MSRENFERILTYHQSKDARAKQEIVKLYGKQIEPHLIKASEVLESLHPFSFDEFKERFYNDNPKPSHNNDVLSALQAKADEMRNKDRIGNAINYELAKKSLARYMASLTDNQIRLELGLSVVPKRKSLTDCPELLTITFEQLTEQLLQDYETWMLNYGKATQSQTTQASPASRTTVGIYLRHVRAVFNEAIEQGIVNRDNYPFGAKKYVIPAGRNVKKALSKEDLDKLKMYDPIPDTYEQRSIDLFLFSYYCNGMNFADICRLRWRDVDLKNKTFSFVRTKTARTKKENQTPIRGELRPETLAIIERWGNRIRRPDGFVFVFLDDTMNAQKQHDTITQLIKVTNKWLKRISERIGIEANVSTYTARHSFATILLRSETPLKFISDSLGHSSIVTTQNYLDSFTNEQTKKYLSVL